MHLRDLRLLTLSYWGFDGKLRTGRLIVHEDVARPMVSVFRELHAKRFPIRRLVPVDAYGASTACSDAGRSFAYITRTPLPSPTVTS